MTANLYWKERLEAKQPIRDEKLRVVEFDVKYSTERPGPWPKSVARKALYTDYKTWFEQVLLPNYIESKFYSSNPARMPKMLTEMAFFMAIGPWLYLDGKNKSVKNYFVKEPTFFEGQWLKVKVRRYFIRLKPWEDHVLAFEAETQLPVVRAAKERYIAT